jgi:tetraacyldisaccharide 4'-kinase
MHWLEQHWYRSGALDRALCLALWPLSLLFGILAAVRRAAYRAGIFSVARLPVPVIVVGNISVGGTGKTPLTIALAQQLRQQQRRPGIICRGYGGSAHTPQPAAHDSDPRVAGDEAVLLARRSGCPVWIGSDRVAAARGLLAANPDCDLLISDDGLQHYALARDFEIAVFDAARGIGNGMLLPAGPLREPPARLAGVGALVLNGDGAPPPYSGPVYRMVLNGERFFNLCESQWQVTASHFSGCKVHAVAAIGNPQRFFDHLARLGIAFDPHPFPDHHTFTGTDLAFGNDTTVIMTEKDAVKCGRFANDRLWVLKVDAAIDGDLVKQITCHLGKPS